MTNVNENEKVNTLNQNTEEARKKVKEARNAIKKARNAIKKVEENQEYTEEDQDTKFLNTKNYYEEITLLVKLAFNTYFSFLKEKEQIKECDAEEFSKSENTEEFQNQKMRVQNYLKEDLTSSDDDDYFDFTLKSIRIYSWKLMGLFN